MTNGFTLIEIVLVIALIALSLGLGWFISLEFYGTYALDAERDTLVSALRKARSQSLRNIGGVPHGLSIMSDRYTLFFGTSYAARNLAFDENIARSAGITLAGPAEIVFGQLTATSSASGTVTLSDGVRQRMITTNYEGRISW